MTTKGYKMDTTQLKRIADAIEEILRLVKKGRLTKCSTLIPDPLCSIARHNDVDQVAMDLGSDKVARTLS